MLYDATAGVMDVQFERDRRRHAGDDGLSAAGFAKGGADKMAPLVDEVLGAQLKRYREFARTQRPER